MSSGQLPDVNDVLYVDSAVLLVNLLEYNLDFENGDTPDGWDRFNCVPEREGAIVKEGNYSLKIMANKTGGGSDAGASQNVFKPEYRGKTFTFGAWVRAPSTNDQIQALGIFDGHGTKYGSPIPRDDQWHWVTVTKTILPYATELRTYGYVLTGPAQDTDDVLYLDSPTLIHGDRISPVPPENMESSKQLHN